MNALTILGNTAIIIDASNGRRLSTISTNALNCVSYNNHGVILLDNGNCFRYNLSNFSNVGKFGPTEKISNINISNNIVIMSNGRKTWRYNIENGICVGS